MPVMSIGIRSGVNWMRLNFSDIVSASLLTSKRLGQAGHAHQQRMAAGEEADRQPLDDVALADDDLAQLLAQPGVDVPQLVDRLDVVLAQPLDRWLIRACAMNVLLLPNLRGKSMKKRAGSSPTPSGSLLGRPRSLTNLRHSSRPSRRRERRLN